MIKRKVFPFFFAQYFILGLGGSIVGPLIPILSDSFKVRLDIMGSALSLNAFGIVIASIFSGIISERFGKKNIFTLGSILFIISFLGLYFSSHFIFFTISYIILGIAIGIIVVNSTSIISDASPLNISKALIKLSIGWMLGASLAPTLVSTFLFLNISWRYLFLSVVLINIILLILILSIKFEGLYNKKNGENFINLFTANRKLLSSLIIILCGIIFFLLTGLQATFGAWFTTYFKGLEVPVAFSSLILTLYLLVFGLGMFAKSFLVAKFSEKKLMLYFLILAFIFLLVSFFIDLLAFKIAFILLFSFSFSAISTICLSISIKQNARYSGSITSIIMSYGFIGVIIFQYTTGYFTENFSTDSIIYISLAALFLLIVFSSILSYYYRPDRK